MNKKEIRTSKIPMEVRAEKDQPTKIIGYPVVFNSPSEDMGFTEIIDPGAFTKTLKEQKKIFALKNHNDDLVLGNTVNNTLTLKVDDKGLYAECEPGTTSYGMDAVESVRRGDVQTCSFGFITVKDKIETDKTTGKVTRTILECRLLEVSFCVPFPAYEDTEVDVRDYFRAIGKDLAILEGKEERTTEETTKPELTTTEEPDQEPQPEQTTTEPEQRKIVLRDLRFI